MTENRRDQTPEDPSRLPIGDEELGRTLGSAIDQTVGEDPTAPHVTQIVARAEAKAKARQTRRVVGSLAASAAIALGAVVGIGALRDSPNEEEVATLAAESDDDQANDAPASPPREGTTEAATGTEPFDPAPGTIPAEDRPTPAELSTGPLLTFEPLATEVGPLSDLRSVGDGRVTARSLDDASGAQRLLITSDGTTWTDISLPADGFGPISLSGDKWVAAAGFSSFEPVPTELAPVFVSEDSGSSWQEMAFDLEGVETASTGGSAYLQTIRFIENVLSSNGVVVAIVQEYVDLDIDRLLADRGVVPDGGALSGYGWGGGTIEVEIDEPSGPESREFTYEELGLTPEEVVYLDGPGGPGRLMVFSGSGSTLSLVYEGESSGSNAVADDAGFAVSAFGEDGPISLTSVDGVEWVTTPGVGNLDLISTDGSRRWAVQWTESGLVVHRGQAGEPLTPVASFDGIDPLGPLAAGPGGLAVAAQVRSFDYSASVAPEFDDGEQYIPEFSVARDGYELRFNEPEGGFTLVDLGTGEPAMVVSPEQMAADEPPPGIRVPDGEDSAEYGFIFEDLETGEILVEFTTEDLEPLFGAATSTSRGGSVALESGAATTRAVPLGDDTIGGPYVAPEQWVGWSSDGTDWGWQTTLDAFGVAGELFAELAVGDGFVLAQVQVFAEPLLPADEPEDEATFEESFGEPEVQWFIAEVPS